MCCDDDNTIDKSDKVTKDALYGQLHSEMRRYRDYELTVATWWTTLLLAMLSGLLVSLFGGKSEFQQFLKDNEVIIWIMTGTEMVLGIVILYILHWTNHRYKILRAWCC